VEQARDAVVQRAAQAAGDQIGVWLRDVLNSSEDLKEWKPARAYPAALAWARCGTVAGESRASRVAQATALANLWAQELGLHGTVLQSRMEDALRELGELAIIDSRSEEFCSELLRRYLEEVARATVPLRTAQERAALQAMLVDSIEMPANLEAAGEGGQATLYVSEDAERLLAYRATELPDEATRTAFLATCQAWKAIAGTQTRHPGYQSLPAVRSAGFTTEDPPRGVVVYDWVDGADLHGRTLPPAALASVAICLSQALEVLELRGVVHRDIRPPNLVLGSDGVPRLVDFGLARLSDASRHTQFEPSEYLAPEVLSVPPRWTHAADIYALGVSLRQISAGLDANPALEEILRQMTLADPARRIRPAVATERLHACAKTMRFYEAAEMAAARFRAALGQFPPDAGWARELALGYEREVKARALGLFDGLSGLHAPAAFLDDVFGAWYRLEYGADGPLGPDTQHLTRLASAGASVASLRDLCAPELRATGYLRHAHAHRLAMRKNHERAVEAMGQRWSQVSDPQVLLRRTVLACARLMGVRMGIPALEELLAAWLGTP